MVYEIDQESLDLIIELQLQDAQSMIKGKYREGEAPDFEFALECFNAELQSFHTLLHDQAITRSVARAVVSDADIIRELVNQEDQARRDRELALNGFGTDNFNQQRFPQQGFFQDEFPQNGESSGTMSDEMTNKLIVLFNGGDDPSPVAESSRKGGHMRPVVKATKRRRCIVCNDEFPFAETLRCACSHDYCRECLSNYVKKAIDDESIFPPRCCGQPIPLTGVNQIFISSDILGKYRAKELEYNAEKRVYCHIPACSTFIPKQFFKDEVATCVKCSKKTCVICKGASHEGDCPKDTATADLLRVAGDRGWKRCYRCRRVVELAYGCNHIYCHCKAEFCYICGKRWKTCGCELWSEDMLVNRTNAANRAAAAPAQRAAPGWGL
ncbi:hypothetical protein V8C35DRAFT_289242 [Trichoderma chlorosporum]